MKELLHKRIAAWADRKQVLLPGTAVVAGVSGGADSVCLLHVLQSLTRLRSFSIFAVHVNHLLRGCESDEDESFVRSLCAQWQVPLQVFREDVYAVAEEKGCSVEQAGRLVRYQCFHRVMQEVGAEYIAVAHHRDDQAETVFFHLLRGSGLEGLCGMEDSTRGILRPFLDTGKDEILAHIAENNLVYRTDSSNQDNSYTRNAIRNELFPLIEKRTGFPVTPSLHRTARLLRIDRDYLQQMAVQHFEGLVVFKGDNSIALARENLNKLHPAMAGRCIRMAWEEITGSITGIEEKHVSALLQLSSGKASGRMIHLPGEICGTVEYGRLFLSRRSQSHSSAPFQVPLTVPGTTELMQQGILVHTALYDREDYMKAFGGLEKSGETSLQQIFDYGKINKGINIKSRCNGDIFYPYHSPGSKKLKEFFIDEKIPRDKRENIPLLAVDNNIIWVMGFRTSEKYRVDHSTRVILFVRVTPVQHEPIRR
ncbi:MAG: tRNA lysidine(34) synthetase TilS [Thermoclostridium sp.]|nr:tRNA lysidine(34) synthetase TilS [Thermoclostridium sp.]